MSSARVFLRGGLASYRAHFGWLNAWVAVPMLVVAPLFQLLFFAYLGRTTGVADDTYFVVGNALLAAALPAVLGAGATITGERHTRTLGMLVASPANRVALFVGRTLPAIVNGFVVSAFCFAAGALVLDVDVAAAAVPRLALVIVVCAFSSAALGLGIGALGLRTRSVAPLGWLVLAVLLLVSGANVPVDRLPDWLQAVGSALPLQHGIEAARAVVAGEAGGRALAVEAGLGFAYLAAAVGLLRVLELESRRTASLETM